LIKTQIYQTPTLDKVGTFESLTQGGITGSHFDGTFTVGQPVPFDGHGHPLIFS
jgi:hypothetical protein